MRLVGKPDIDRTYLFVNRENQYPEEDNPYLHTSLDKAYKDETLIIHEVGFRPKRGTIALTRGVITNTDFKTAMSEEYSGNTPGFTLKAIPIIGSSKLGIRENTSYSGNFIQVPRFQQFLDNTGAHSLNYLRKMETTMLFLEEPALNREFQKGKSVVKYGTSGTSTYHFLGFLPGQHYHSIAKQLGISLENKEPYH